MYESDRSIDDVVEPIAHHKNMRTPMPGTTAIPHNSADAWLANITAAALFASQRGTFLAPPASSVSHIIAAARGIDDILPTTATLAVGLAALR